MRETIIGREPELSEIEASLVAVPDGARFVLIEGDPGIGKTTLWLAGIDIAGKRGWRILSARPSESEATFGYAGIGDLLISVEGEYFDRLPAPQRRALDIALIREEPGGGSADAGAIAVAFLNLIRELCSVGPLVVAVDDVQWLDTPSLSTLGFAARRLGDEPVGLLLASRADPPTDRRLGLDRSSGSLAVARIGVGPLGQAAIGRLLEDRLGRSYPRGTLRRIQVASGGNPLYAVELARSVRDDPAALDPRAELEISTELAALIGTRLEDLPASTQGALAIAAALAQPTVGLLARVDPTIEAGTLRPAIEAGFVVLDGGAIRFTHPLRAYAARAGTSATRRREIHAVLASIVADPEERARHLALAADAPDENAAAALEHAAGRAADRGAVGAASELAGLARRLTPQDGVADVRRRGLLEAQYLSLSGDMLGSRRIIDELLAGWPDGPDRGRALQLLGKIEWGLDLRRSADLVREALAMAGDDDRLRMGCEGLLTAIIDETGGDIGEAIEHGRSELALAERIDDKVGIATSMRGLARNEQRRTGRSPDDLIERAIALEPIVQAANRPATEWPSWTIAEMLTWTDDVAAGLTRWTALREGSVARGDEFSLGWLLVSMIPYECVAGAFGQALDDAELCIDLAAGLGDLHAAAAHACRALVSAHLGDEEDARREAGEVRELMGLSDANTAGRRVAWALGTLELSLGDAEAAHVQLAPLVAGRRAAGVAEPGALRFLPDELEALIALGALDEALELLDWFESLAIASGRTFALAACQRGRGLLHVKQGDLDAGLGELERSRSTYATIADPIGTGRTLFALGAALRQAGRRRDARSTLEASLAMFAGLGARLWSDRVRAELGRIGGRIASPDRLTPSEHRVAELVAEGQTNREVAAALVVSERTVEGHLSNVYSKLGIRSRTELTRLIVEERQSHV